MELKCGRSTILAIPCISLLSCWPWPAGTLFADDVAEARAHFAAIKASLTQIKTGECVISVHEKTVPYWESRPMELETKENDTTSEYLFDLEKGFVNLSKKNNANNKFGSMDLVIGPEGTWWAPTSMKRANGAFNKILRKVDGPLHEIQQQEIYPIRLLSIIGLGPFRSPMETRELEALTWNSFEKWSITLEPQQGSSTEGQELVFTPNGTIPSESRIRFSIQDGHVLPVLYRFRFLHPVKKAWSEYDTTETKWTVVDGVSVPSAIRWHSTQGARESDRDMSFEWVHVNQEIAPDRFRRAAIHLADGDLAIHNEFNPPLIAGVYQGKEVGAAPPPVTPLTGPAGSGRRLFILGVINGAAILIGLTVVLYRRFRRQTQSGASQQP